jgi:dipeptidyl-peptidase-3
MKPEELKHYLADQPPTVVRLEIEKHFALLSEQQKRYAHFISKYVASHLLLWAFFQK